MNLLNFSSRVSNFVDAADVDGNIRNNRLNLQYLAQIDAAYKKAGISTGVVYPIIGNEENTHSYNLLDPAQYQITWNGTIIHSSGIRSVAEGYGDTGFNPFVELSQFDTHICVYTGLNINGNYIDFGAITNTSNMGDRIEIAPSFYAFPFVDANSVNTRINGSADSNRQGCWLSTRITNNKLSFIKNGDIINVNNDTEIYQLPNGNINILRCNDLSGVSYFNSQQRIQFASIGNGTTEQKAKILSHDIFVAQRSIGRA